MIEEHQHHEQRPRIRYLPIATPPAFPFRPRPELDGEGPPAPTLPIVLPPSCASTASGQPASHRELIDRTDAGELVVTVVHDVLRATSCVVLEQVAAGSAGRSPPSRACRGRPSTGSAHRRSACAGRPRCRRRRSGQRVRDRCSPPPASAPACAHGRVVPATVGQPPLTSNGPEERVPGSGSPYPNRPGRGRVRLRASEHFGYDPAVSQFKRLDPRA